EIQLANREAEQVHSQTAADTGDEVAGAAGKRRTDGGSPRDAGIGKREDVHRYSTVVHAAFEEADERRPHFEIADRDAGSEQSIERGARSLCGGRAIRRVE